MNIYDFISFKRLLWISIVFLLLISAYNTITGKKGNWNDYNTSWNFSPRSVVDKVERKDSSGEIECKRVLESIFHPSKFEKVRLVEFTNPVTNSPLELDCYNSYLKLAVEYNGRQHYEHVPFFHQNKEAFRNQQYRDLMKVEMCKTNGIRLITVPYHVKTEHIENHILGELKNMNLH